MGKPAYHSLGLHNFYKSHTQKKADSLLPQKFVKPTAQDAFNELYK